MSAILLTGLSAPFISALLAEEELGPFDSLSVVEDEGVSESEDDELHELGSLSFVQAFQGLITLV